MAFKDPLSPPNQGVDMKPKDALKRIASGETPESYNEDDLNLSEAICGHLMEIAEAAIPVAELHQKIVETIKDHEIQETPLTFIKAFGRAGFEELVALLTQLEEIGG